MPFDSAEAAVNSIIDPISGEPSALLIRLMEIHRGEYIREEGLPGLRALTQRLWVPKDPDGRPIKVPHKDISALDAAYSTALREES